MERDVPVFPSSVLLNLGVDRIFSEKVERVGKMIFGLMNELLLLGHTCIQPQVLPQEGSQS